MRFTTKLTALLTLAASAPAFAADSGMPQLDPTWYPSQLFWMVVSFVVLYALVSAFIAPRIGGVLEQRETAINEAIALAEKLKKEANSTRGNFEAASAEARMKAAQIVAEAQAVAAKEAAAAHARLNDEIEKKLAKSEADIKAATTKAMAKLEEAATPLAQEIAEKLVGSKVDKQSVAAATRNLVKAA